MTSCTRPITSVESLRNSRKSLGDGTLDGRSKIAAPPRERPAGRNGVGRRSKSSEEAGGGEGVPADPRTITVEARGVDIPVAGAAAIVPWQRTIGGRHTVRVPEPDHPSATVQIPSRGVWLPRLELEWDPTEFGPTSPFRGGGEVRLQVNGYTAWPVGEGSTRPPGGTEARTFVDSLPSLELREGDVVSLRLDHDSNRPRLLSRALLTLTQVEPFAGAIEGDDPLPGPPPPTYEDEISQVGRTNCFTECPQDGPVYWVRFPGGGNDPIRMRTDERDGGDGLCFRTASGGGPPLVDDTGPFGDAAQQRSEDPTGFYSESGNGCRGALNTMAMWFRNDAHADGSSGWIFHHRPAVGAASGEARGPAFLRRGGNQVTFRVEREDFTVGAIGAGWHFAVGVVDDTDTPTTGFADIRVWVDGVLRLESEVEMPGDSIVGGSLRFFAGVDTFNTPFQYARGVALAEVMGWDEPLTVAEVQDLNERVFANVPPPGV